MDDTSTITLSLPFAQFHSHRLIRVMKFKYFYIVITSFFSFLCVHSANKKAMRHGEKTSMIDDLEALLPV